MKINIKTLKGTEFFEVTLDETATVGELKAKIASEKEKDVDTIKLVHKGKQLNDDSVTLKTHGIKDNDFIILMLFVKKGEKVQEPPKPAAQIQPAANTTSSAVTNPVNPPAQQQQQQQQPTNASTTAASQSNDLQLGAEQEATIKEIQEMGFDRPRILQALRAAFNNKERAIDYLLSGNIPQIHDDQQAPSSQSQQVPAGSNAADASGIEQLQQLTQNPQFQQIAQAIRQNPALLEPVMQQLSQTNPEVALLLQQNPQIFLQLLLQASDNEGGQTLPPNAIQVTEEEKADIDDIVSLGFNEDDVIEAYLACDKQKELAINYLFDARENGALLSEHIENEEIDALENPNGLDEEEDDEEDDDEDDFMYQ